MNLGSLLYRPESTGLTGALGAWAEQIRARRIERENDALPDTVTEFRRGAAGRDGATISDEARRLRDAERGAVERTGERTAGLDDEPTDGEQEMLRELEARDREIRAHEQAHKAAAGDLAVGGPSYTYQTGPDGKRYAIGGEVKVRLAKGRTPEETIRNMERAIRAANAPDSPSGPDRAVAAQAARLAAEARRELQQEPRPSVDVLA